MDAIYKFAEVFENITFDDLPADTVEAAKKLILDTVSVGVAGSSSEGVSELLHLFEDQGGKAESTAWIFGDRLPCASAAQLNATMIHALDFDDTHDRGVIHVGVTSVPTAFAIADKIENVSGKQLITAVILGVEIASRLCLANTVSMFERGWHYSTLHGNFSAAAVAGKLMGLSLDKMVSAYGLAYHQASGNLQGLIDGTLAKRFGPGFAVRNGIMAVQMASRGITGSRNVLQGKHGFFNVYHQGDYDLAALLCRLGETFEVDNLSYKPYPCCRENHVSIDGTLGLVAEYGIKADDVKEILIQMSHEGMTAVFDPLIEKQNPKTVVDAQFSTPWTVAWALIHGSVGLEAFTPESIKNDEVLALARKVQPVPDDTLSQLGVSPTVVNIITKSGKTFTKKIEIAYGSPEKQMTIEAVTKKMNACIANAARDLNDEEAEKLKFLCLNLEKVNDVRQITKILAMQ